MASVDSFPLKRRQERRDLELCIIHCTVKWNWFVDSVLCLGGLRRTSDGLDELRDAGQVNEWPAD